MGNELLKPSVVGRNKLEVCLFLSGSNRSRKLETCENFSAHFVEKRLIHLSRDFSVLSTPFFFHLGIRYIYIHMYICMICIICTLYH